MNGLAPRRRVAGIALALGLLALPACGGGGGSSASGKCSAEIFRSAGGKGEVTGKSVGAAFPELTARLILARGQGVSKVGTADDIAACLADGYDDDPSPLFAAYRHRARAWGEQTAKAMVSTLQAPDPTDPAGHDLYDAINLLVPAVRVSGRDVGLMGGVLADAAKDAGLKKGEGEDLLDDIDACREGALFAALYNEPDIRSRVPSELPELRSGHTVAVDGAIPFPTSNKACRELKSTFYGMEDPTSAAGGLGMADVVLASMRHSLAEAFMTLTLGDRVDRK